MTEILIVPEVGISPAIGINEKGTQLKTRLLIDATGVKSIDNEVTRDRAITVAGKIKTHLKEVEANRKEVKKPFLETGNLIDLVAREHVTMLEIEARRIDKLVGEFEEDRQEKIREQKKLLESPDLGLALEAEEALGKSETSKLTGGAMRHDWDIEITDIKALYAAHPQCVRLTADILSIKDLLKAGIKPPGVIATKKVAYSARAVKPRFNLHNTR